MQAEFSDMDRNVWTKSDKTIKNKCISKEAKGNYMDKTLRKYF